MAECAFCGAIVTGKLSEEHVFPDWLIQELPTDKEAIRERKLLTLGPNIELIADRSRSEGPAAAPSKVRAVCRDECNGGWMSRMERRIKPILLPLIHDVAHTVSVDDQRRIALWAIKTTMMLEYTDDQTRVTTPEQRRQLYESRDGGTRAGQIPKTFEVWMGGHKGTGIPSYWYSHRTGLGVFPVEVPTYDTAVPHHNNIQYTFLVAGALVLVVLGHAMRRVARVQTSFGIDRQANRRLVKIHNATADLAWPLGRPSSSTDLHRMAVAVLTLSQTVCV